jgi:hypothetical protein
LSGCLIERWLAVRDVGTSTTDNRGYMIRSFIRPAWGDTALSDLSTEEITQWENALPAREGITPRMAGPRALLGTSDLVSPCNSLSGAKETRTPDPLLAKQVLFQLSYSPALR